MNRKEPVRKIERNSCRDWVIDAYRVRHSSNRYFSIACVQHGDTEKIMIDQPEVGILGFVITESPENRKWLIQNKPEPGNINYYQYAPTVQATKSNYERVHGGKPTPFLNLFLNKNSLLVDTECSEQGDRYLNKFNRNCKCISKASLIPNTDESYFWVNTNQLKQKLRTSYGINTDARSVITAGFWSLLTSDRNEIFKNASLDSGIGESLNNSYHHVGEHRLVAVESLLDSVKNSHNTNYCISPLKEMQYHTFDESGIVDKENNPIVSYYEVTFNEREVQFWQQPLLERLTLEHCVLLFHIKEDIAYFYLSAYPEAGFLNRVELGPSFQTGIGHLKTSKVELEQNFKNIEILSQIDQSDEGGRFYRNFTRYTLGRWKNSPDELTKENGIWLSAGEIERLSLMKGKLTNELRSTLSLLLSFA